MMYHRYTGEKVQKEIILPGKKPVESRTESDTGSHANPENTMNSIHFPGSIVLGDETDSGPVKTLDNEITIILEVERRR